jgi:hypothetical protein
MFANLTKIAEQVGGFSNPWLVFKTHDDDIANQCTQTMLARWNDRLGGANQYTPYTVQKWQKVHG